VQVLDQQVTIARPVAEQRGNLVPRRGLELAAFMKRGRTPAPGTGRYPALFAIVFTTTSHRTRFLFVASIMNRKDTA
jgi:hypothetical protein